MKKIVALIVTLALTFSLCMPALAASGGTITDLTASGTTTSATVSGSVTPPVGETVFAVTVELLSSGGDSVALRSFSVSDGTFSGTFPGLSLTAQSTYTVRAANYEGGDWASAEFTVPVPVVSVPAAVEVPAATDGAIAATATVSGQTATVDFKTDALEQTASAGGLTLDLAALDPSISAAVLPASAMQAVAAAAAAADSPIESLTVALGTASVTFDSGALSAIGAAGGENVTLAVTPVNRASLSEADQQLVGDRPVFELDLSADGNEIHDFGGGVATIALPYTPAEGEDTAGIVVWRMVSGVPQAVSCRYENGKILFETGTFSTYVIGYFPFSDVAGSQWYYANVVYAYQNELMDGVSDSRFAPEEKASRAMLVTILYRLAGKPAVSSVSSFSDVANGMWYSDAVIWAAENGIVNGFDDGTFRPLETVTREQMALILYQYAAFAGSDVTATGSLSAFTDAADVSDWAAAAVGWASAEGILNGMNGGLLSPQGDAIRAQLAAVLERFYKTVIS